MSAVDICNLALSNLGAKVIASMTEDSKEARACNRHYDIIRQYLLRKYKWDFNTRIVALALTTDALVDGWEYCYGYPNNALAVRRIIDLHGTDVALKYKYQIMIDSTLTQKIIYCDVADAEMEYAVDLENTDIFGAIFKKALAYSISSEITMEIVGDPSVKDKMTSYAMSFLAQAEAADARESYNPPQHTSDLITCRGGGVLQTDEELGL